jgi:hypothetical protein
VGTTNIGELPLNVVSFDKRWMQPVAVLPERSPAVTANNDAIPAHMGESGNPLGLERFRIFPGEAGGVKEGLQRWRNLKQPLDYSALCRALQQCAPYAGLSRDGHPHQ